MGYQAGLLAVLEIWGILPTINKGKAQGGRAKRQKKTKKQTNKQKKTTAIVLLAVRDLPECNAHLDYEL